MSNDLVKEIEKNFIAEETLDATTALEWTKTLKKEKAFWLARRVLKIAQEQLSNKSASDANNKLKLAQELAMCTYKDPDLANDTKFDDAIEILKSEANLDKTDIQETLGIAGAVYKYKWQTQASKINLELSLEYYMRGYKEGIEKDKGYTAINAAYVLDALADIEKKTAQKAGEVEPDTAKERCKKAAVIRNEIIAALVKPDEESLDEDWWFFVTIAEAYFGLGKYKEATECLEKAKKLPDVADWEHESTAKQLVSLARFRGEFKNGDIDENKDTDVWKVLRGFLGDDIAVRSLFIGKVGLALSGGGIRASLFHIGVLAKLAECDMLRHIDVISCVSGGSIIGAYYYLKLRNLLQTTPDNKILRAHYINIVSKIETEFLECVKSDILWEALQHKLTHMTKSLSECLAEMYQKQLFSKVKDKKVVGKKIIAKQIDKWDITELIIKPLNSTGKPQNDFNPKNDNWRRQANVPILVLNATALNTGHNFQFTATWMGEPPAGIDSEIDANYRLRRLYYEEAPKKYKKFDLGRAVAASTCIPGLFGPIELEKLYENKTVRLVDGGVNDNQGSASLMDQNCTVLIISDASGQMSSEDKPSSFAPLSLYRSYDIFQTCLRSAQFRELHARKQTSLLQGLLFLHLKKELEADPVDWIGCKLPTKKKKRSSLTTYGINRKCQEYLADIRTDLDSFNEIEAHSLMTSGYLMTEKMMPDDFKYFTNSALAHFDWEFLKKGMAICEADVDQEIEDTLKYAAKHKIINKIIEEFLLPVSKKVMILVVSIVLLVLTISLLVLTVLCKIDILQFVMGICYHLKEFLQ